MDLTDMMYWRQIHAPLRPYTAAELQAQPPEWLPPALPALRAYEGQRLLELGCAPGRVSAMICHRVKFRAEGIDFADAEEIYTGNLRAAGVSHPVFHRSDVRAFRPEAPFDVVISAGLVEHFDDPLDMLAEHDRLLRDGGLCLAVIPHFRRVQYAYHYLFDRPDLLRHNVKCMTPSLFERFAARHGHEILVLGYAGRLRFWGVDESGGAVRRFARRAVSKVVREAARLVGRALPDAHPSLAPWIVYVGRKPDHAAQPGSADSRTRR